MPNFDDPISVVICCHVSDRDQCSILRREKRMIGHPPFLLPDLLSPIRSSIVPPIADVCVFSLGDFQRGVVQHMQAVLWIILNPIGSISVLFRARYGHIQAKRGANQANRKIIVLVSEELVIFGL